MNRGRGSWIRGQGRVFWIRAASRRWELCPRSSPPSLSMAQGTGISSYRDLQVWQRGMDLVVESYRLTEKLPNAELYGLVSQIRRAAVSIPANIAEGHGRYHTREFLRHLSIAKGSLMELETELIAAGRLGFIPEPEVRSALRATAELGRMLAGLTRSLRARTSDPCPLTPDPRPLFMLPALRLALRALRRSPTFTATAVLILGLGIGMAVAMFTVADTVLLRPLPVRDQEGIVLPRIVDPRGVDLVVAPTELDELRRASQTMSAIAGEAHQGAFGTVLWDGDRSLVLRAAWVTGNFFDVLGARPALGRLFRSEDESLTEPSVLVLSYDTWQRRFAGDSGVLGRQLTNPYTRRSYTIIGVAPAGLAYPAGAEYWSPMVYGGGLDVVARLAPTATPRAARGESFSTMREMYRKQHARNWEEVAGARIRTFAQAVLGDVRPA